MLEFNWKNMELIYRQLSVCKQISQLEKIEFNIITIFPCKENKNNIKIIFKEQNKLWGNFTGTIQTYQSGEEMG